MRGCLQRRLHALTAPDRRRLAGRWKVDDRDRAGKIPEFAKPVPIAAVMVIIVGVVAWVAAEQMGGTLDDEVLREGTAVISDDCYRQLSHRACPAAVTWDDGSTEATEVRADRDLEGTVDVEEHLTFESRRGPGQAPSKNMHNTPIAWSADHRPTGKPVMFPVVFGGSMLVTLILAGFFISLASDWFERRSRSRWAKARRGV